MDIKTLVRVANRVDAKGIHSIADAIDDVVEDLVEIDGVKCLVEEHLRPLSAIAQIVDTLNRQGHTSLADVLDRNIALEALRLQNAVDAIISIYKEKHRIAHIRGFCKSGSIRKDDLSQDQRCPFGLPIPDGCKNVGDLIYDMDEDPEEFAKNKIIFEKYELGHECPFATQILENNDAVNCNYGTPNQGREIPDLYRGSPIYPKLWEGFNTLNLDRSYYQHRDFGNYSFYG